MSPRTKAPPSASFTADRGEDGALRLALSGPLTAARLHRTWKRALEAAERADVRRMIVDVSAVPKADGAGAGLLIDLRRVADRRKIAFDLTGANDQLRELLGLYEPETFLRPPPDGAPDASVPEEVGEATVRVWTDFRDQVAYIGEVCSATLYAIAHPRRLRWNDILVVAERSGVDALPIVLLLGFLIGLIMSFQAAVPMQQFGVEIYVADLISLSMVKELGALITAVILAGRTGSAFAAELGTMKINEELNALETLGLDPMRFLVVGRVIATVLTTPLLTLFAIAAGLLGGLVVLLSMDYTAVAYFREAISMLTVSGFAAGMLKSFVFGFQIAAIGCMRGLQTRSGASAVGEAATRAVVTGIIVIIATDGLFAIVYYFLGL